MYDGYYIVVEYDQEDLGRNSGYIVMEDKEEAEKYCDETIYPCELYDCKKGIPNEFFEEWCLPAEFDEKDVWNYIKENSNWLMEGDVVWRDDLERFTYLSDETENYEKEKEEKEIDQEVKKYENQGFNDWQMKQIYLGLEDGVDVSKYADPKFDEDQMHEIRKGLEKGLDVNKYADLKFDFSQMHEIRKGLRNGLDVSKYADPKFNSDQMEQIRWGLEADIDVSKYADPKFNESQMFQIREGLEKGLDVSKYADPKLNDIRMERIKKNLEKSKFKDRKKDIPEIKI